MHRLEVSLIFKFDYCGVVSAIQGFQKSSADKATKISERMI